MDKLTKSMRRTDKTIKSMLAAQKRTRRAMSATDKKIKAMIAARPRADKKFERLIALLEKGSKRAIANVAEGRDQDREQARRC